MKTWIKLYTKLLDDPEIGAMPLERVGMWALLLTLAGKLDHRDAEDIETGQLDTLENVAWHLRRPLDEVQQAIEAFTELGMIHENDGCLYITKYRERQQRPPSARRDAVRLRVQEYRERSKNGNGDEQDGNGVTEPLPEDDNDTPSVSVSSSVSTLSKSESVFGSAYSCAEKAFGRQLTPTEGDYLGELCDEYATVDAAGWQYVFAEAAKSNARNLRYVEGILKRLGKPKPGQSWYTEYSEHIQR